MLAVALVLKMDGANADSDHSMTWEDFFGSTTDLTPTLIGIYDSLLEPAKSVKPVANQLEKAKDARNDPPVLNQTDLKMTEKKDSAKNKETPRSPPKDPSKIAGSVKLPIATINKSSLYSMRTISDKNGASDEKNKNGTTSCESTVLHKENKVQKTLKDTRQFQETTTFDNLSPNVKRMITGAGESAGLKFQKKTATVGRASVRHRSNIPLVGATSKISQSGVEILPSVEIYDQPCGLKSFGKSQVDNNNESHSKTLTLVKPDFKINEEQTTYDVPTNNRPAIYDVPNSINKTAFESLSLPYIDQSIELSITSNDREFDTKLSPKESSPQKAEVKNITEGLQDKVTKICNEDPAINTNSLHRKEFVVKNDSPSKQLLKTGPYPEAIGSTGNLKTCAIPEKDVVRLNPPTVEVTRPLSMSSIASSSSTSSSGVQNKGGVNSAYLASIESLDDHSDVDMTSANGSNNFVNSAGILNTSVSEERHSEDMPCQPDEMSGLSQLERVCAEIVQTENVYVEDLRQVVEGYLHEWRRDTTFSEEELSELFNNIEDIYNFNKSLCVELNSCRLDATSIARCFVDNTAGFSVYTSYCTGYPRTMARLAHLASSPHSARQFRDRQMALGHPLPLASYLLKPVQRILKYHLLLQNVVKQCASRETEYALLKMTGIAQHIDDMKRRHEHAVRVQEIQSLLYGWNGPDLTTYGELCAEGTFRVFGAKAMRHAFLFDKMLLITKNREDGILAYKSHIMCNNMMLVESIAGAPLSFHVIPWDAPRAQLTLQARSPRHKREWTLLLKRVILENYNAVIPSHARQLVMELGQNKTDDDMLAEKSHNLITQASIRKQLSAPEYLEKRKLERERRKSFENGIRGRFKKANRKYIVPSSRTEVSQECDCLQVSAEKGTDYTCDICYIDLCSDCESENTNKDKVRDSKCSCRNDDNNDTDSKCPDCDKALQYIDSGSTEHLERKPCDCKCSDFKSSQESFCKEFPSSLNKTRGYYSSDNIVSFTKSKEDLSDNNSLNNIRNIPKTCLKCAKIKENIAVTDSVGTLHRKSRCIDKHKTDTLRSKSKEDPQRSKLSKIGTWRRKSEPGLQQGNAGLIAKRSLDSESERMEVRGSEKIEFECRNCGSNKITKKPKINEMAILLDPEKEGKHGVKTGVEVKMYNTTNIPKKISKIKKSRAKGLRLISDTTAKFYTDFSTDVSTENILHISESNDSLNVDKPNNLAKNIPIPLTISKDEDIDEETYKKLIEKTDSFKKNELEKVKYLSKEKVINEGSEDEGLCKVETGVEEVIESCEEVEQPLEQIISQLLMQNREFQKLLKKQQQRSTAHRRHQRLLKSHSTPEQVILARNSDLTKLKPKFTRQSSENFDCNTKEEDLTMNSMETDTAVDISEEDHIYETLRVDSRVDESLHSLNTKSKSIQHNPHISRPKRVPSPPNCTIQVLPTKGVAESDYVYLSFDQIQKTQDEDDIYDVPSKFPEKVEQKTKCNDYYITMDNLGPPTNDDNLYDSLIEVCRRKKDIPNISPEEYLPMSSEPLSPNTPEIWLSRQKEHFNVSRDRKSGSLPRSFQIVTGNQEENNLSSFKCKPNSNSKTYLNRDGKVMSTDRPFTIASDQSEISYDDVESYMSEGNALKFNKSNISSETDHVQNISQSTLELEEEIDRCYKNNFEKVAVDPNKDDTIITTSTTSIVQPIQNTSTTSSCEVLACTEDKPKDIEIIHPEHKIYKPTSSMRSLKNVLNRFKNRTPNKNNDDVEVNANDQSSPDCPKVDLKSPTSEKRANLNPRNYSKNLLQRFRSIISDEHSDDSRNRSEQPVKSKSVDDTQIITENIILSTTEFSTTLLDDALSKSVCEHSTISETQNEKNNLENFSQSCDNICEKQEKFQPSYNKSVNLVTNASNNSSPSKSNNSSYHNLNKLPIYMQGSKNLGARIAQSDYVDPTTLKNEKTALKNINILINKNAVRPDSLFSNSSFVTSSSEGTYQETQSKPTTIQPADDIVEFDKKTSELFLPKNSDECCYEKSFERIEQITDGDVFRDSAVYSDQEDCDVKTDSSDKHKVNRIQSFKRSTFYAQKVTVTSSTCEKITLNSRLAIPSNNNQLAQVKEGSDSPSPIGKITKPKVAPPVPMKPKMSNISNLGHSSHSKNFILRSNTFRSTEQSSTSKSVTASEKNTKAPSLGKLAIVKLESTHQETKVNHKEVKSNEELKSKEVITSTQEEKEEVDTTKKLQPQGNLQMKRLTFERASLDSKTRKLKPTNEIKRSSIETPKTSTNTSKSVLERRMAIEQITKANVKSNQTVKKPTQLIRPKSITMKVATFERSVSENDKGKLQVASSNVNAQKTNIPQNNTSVNDTSKSESNLENDPKGSWVKQVVNKFQ